MRVRIKLCGITSERDALEAAYLGVDALGFDFRAGSPRAITPRDAARIGGKLPPFVTRVGVFADQSAQAIVEAADTARLGSIQLTGHEPAGACGRLPVPWYKGFRLAAGFPLDTLADYACTAYRLDCRAADAASRKALWGLARAAGRFGRIVLAGGLDPATLPAAIDAVQPWALDLVEEAEVSPGVKDIDRLETIIRAVRLEDLARE